MPSQSKDSRQPKLAARLLRPLVAVALIITGLLPSASAQFFENSSLRASFRDFSASQIYVDQPSGFETFNSRISGTFTVEDISNSDASVSFTQISEQPSNNGVPVNPVLVDNQGNLISLQDFDDLHHYNFGLDSTNMGQLITSQAVDVVYVTWLSDQKQARKLLENRLTAVRVSERIRDSSCQKRLGEENSESERADSKQQEIDSRAALPEEVEPNAPSGFALLVGVRGIQSESRESIYAEGGLLGGFSNRTYANNEVMSPQAGLAWNWRFGSLSIKLQGTALAGYNFGNVEQDSKFGTELEIIPGATNRLLYASPTESYTSESADRFSPSGELLAESKWQITEAFALRFSWSGVVVENVVFTDDRLGWGLPDMGLQDPGNQRLAAHTFFCGLEFVR